MGLAARWVTANAPLAQGGQAGPDAQRPGQANAGVGGAFSTEVGTPSAVPRIDGKGRA